MATATTHTIPLALDERYKALAFTAWDAGYNKVLEIAREQDCLPGMEHIYEGELVVNMATAPQRAESQKYDDYAPGQGKSFFVPTKLFGFNFRASEELRLYGGVKARLDEYAQKMADINLFTLRVMVNNLLNNAFDTAYPIPYTGGALISTSHTLAGAAGGTGTNRPGTDADLSEDLLEALVQLLAETVNEDGAPMGLNPSRLATAFDQWGDVQRYTRSMTQVDQAIVSAGSTTTSGNAINAVASKYNIQPYHDQLLLDADAVFLIADESPLRVLYADKGRFTVGDGYVDQGNKDWVWSSRMRANAYAKTWRGIVGTSGA